MPRKRRHKSKDHSQSVADLKTVVERLFGEAQFEVLQGKSNAWNINTVWNQVARIQEMTKKATDDFTGFSFTKDELKKLTRQGQVIRLYNLFLVLKQKHDVGERKKVTVDRIVKVVNQLQGFPEGAEEEYRRCGGIPLRFDGKIYSVDWSKGSPPSP